MAAANAGITQAEGGRVSEDRLALILLQLRIEHADVHVRERRVEDRRVMLVRMPQQLSVKATLSPFHLSRSDTVKSPRNRPMVASFMRLAGV